MKKMLFVEDHPLVAEYTCMLFRDLTEGVEIHHAETASKAEYMLSGDTDWFRIWLDLDVPGAYGLSLVRHVHNKGLSGCSAIITANTNILWQAEIEKLGFLGYVPKAIPIEKFKNAIKHIINGERFFPENKIKIKPTRLTKRQIDILNLISTGVGTKEISRKLNLTPGTVDNYVSAIIHSLSAKSRTHAVALGIEHGYISLPHENNTKPREFI